MPKLSLKEVSKYLGVSDKTVYRMVSNREIPHYKIGRKLVFDTKDLDQFLASCRVEAVTDDMVAKLLDH